MIKMNLPHILKVIVLMINDDDNKSALEMVASLQLRTATFVMGRILSNSKPPSFFFSIDTKCGLWIKRIYS